VNARHEPALGHYRVVTVGPSRYASEDTDVVTPVQEAYDLVQDEGLREMGKGIHHERDPRSLARQTVVVHGWYGHGNLGDEALLRALSHLIHDIAPEVRVFATAGAPAALEELHPGIVGIPTRTAWGPRLTRAVTSGARAVLVGGGNLLQEYATGRSTVAGLAARLREASRLGARVAMLGVGVGRVSEEGLGELARLAPHIEGVIVREAASFARAEAWGLPWRLERGCDLALLDAARPRPARERTRRVLVNLKGALGRDPEDEARVESQSACIAGAIGPYADRGFELVGVPFRRTDEDDCDHSALRRVAALEPRLRLLDEVPTPDELETLARSSTHAIASRLHSAILTAGAGCAVACVPYADKCSDFFRDLALDDQWIEADADADALSDALAAATRDLPRATAAIDAARAESLPRYRALLERCLR
jgi:polysaccharide pyruvyl transferase WcaK-like protein